MQVCRSFERKRITYTAKPHSVKFNCEVFESFVLDRHMFSKGHFTRPTSGVFELLEGGGICFATIKVREGS